NARELGDLEIYRYFFARELVRKSIERIKLHLFARSRANVEALQICRRQFSCHNAVLDDQSPGTLYELLRGRPIRNGVIKMRPAMNPPMCAAYATPPAWLPEPSMPRPLIS